MLKRSLGIPRRVLGQVRLLLKDPETFGRNLSQYFNPGLFEDRLIDIVHAVPMFVEHRGGQPASRLNILDTNWTRTGMTGGPNTVVALASVLALNGVRIRFVATVVEPQIDAAWLQAHAAALIGGGVVPEFDIAHAGDPARPLPVGDGDVFLATHWSTARQLEAVLPTMRHKQFFYMLQEFEAGFYPWSSNYAGVVATYGMEFWPIVNERLLAEFLFSQPFGRLSDPATRDRSIVFEPAVDRGKFHPRVAGAAGPAPAPKRLLFYARPTNPRNMFGLGLSALRQASQDPAFAGWEFVAIGSRGSLPDMPLANGHVLRAASWSEYQTYGDTLRNASVLLCPMLSPHTSYPVLEMAACGGLSVTNVFRNKSREALAELAVGIVAVDATVEGFSAGLIASAKAVNAGRTYAGQLSSPGNWREAFQPVVDRVLPILSTLAAPD